MITTDRLPNITPIGVLLRERRHALGMNANVLGISTGLTDGRIRAIEAWNISDRRADIPIDSEVTKIAGALGTTIAELVRGAHERGARSVVLGTRRVPLDSRLIGRYRQPVLPAVTYLSVGAP
jgi:hypothetical protein